MVLELCMLHPSDLNQLLRPTDASRAIPLFTFRLLLALDIARGLEFLHRCDPPVVHRGALMYLLVLAVVLRCPRVRASY